VPLAVGGHDVASDVAGVADYDLEALLLSEVQSSLNLIPLMAGPRHVDNGNTPAYLSDMLRTTRPVSPGRITHTRLRSQTEASKSAPSFRSEGVLVNFEHRCCRRPKEFNRKMPTPRVRRLPVWYR
jgi:hypothetical protein